MKATNNAPALGHLSPVERMYNQMLTDLKSVIEEAHGTLSGFVTNQKAAAELDALVPTFELRNLYRVFSESNAQRMSLELYVRLCASVGIGGDRMKAQRIGASNISLIDYLVIDNDIILKSFLELQYQGS